MSVKSVPMSIVQCIIIEVFENVKLVEIYQRILVQFRRMFLSSKTVNVLRIKLIPIVFPLVERRNHARLRELQIQSSQKFKVLDVRLPNLILDQVQFRGER